MSQDHEILSLDELGIESISLETSEPATVNVGFGNTFGQFGLFKYSNGNEGTIANLNFFTDLTDGFYSEEIALTEVTLNLPDIPPMGVARGLRESMEINPELRSVVIDFMNTTDLIERVNLVDKLLFLWAETTAFDSYYDRFSDTHGEASSLLSNNTLSQFDKISISEVFSGSYISQANPNQIAGRNFTQLNDFYNSIKEYVYKSLTYQSDKKR